MCGILAVQRSKTMQTGVQQSTVKIVNIPGALYSNCSTEHSKIIFPVLVLDHWV